MQKIKKFLFLNTNTTQTIIKNTFWLFSGEILGRLLRAILVIYAARVLGTEGWGIFSYGLSLITIFMTFADIKISMLVTREASQNNEDKKEYISTSFFIKLFFLIVSLILTLIIAPKINSIPEALSILPIISFLLLSDSLREFLLSINRATQHMQTEGLIKVISNGSIILFGFVFIFFSPSVESLAFAYLAGSIVGTITLIIISRNLFTNITSHFSKPKIKTIINSAWPIGIIAISTGIMFNVDILMLGRMSTTEQLGIYSASQRLLQLFYIIPSLFSLSLLPTFSKTIKENKEKIVELIQKSLSIIFILGLPIIIGGLVLRQEIILIVFGSEYLESYITFSLLLPTILAIFPNFILKNVIFALDAQKKFIIPVILGVACNITLNLILIPKYGINGAAITTVFSQMIMTIVNWRLLKKMVPFHLDKHITKIILANILLLSIILILKVLNIYPMVIIIVALFFYIGILFLVKEKNTLSVVKMFR